MKEIVKVIFAENSTQRLCGTESCPNKHASRNLCQKHLSRLKRNGDVNIAQLRITRGTLEERFWQNVDKRGEDECWEWLGAKNDLGYGQITYQKTFYKAPRLSWQIAYGKPPKNWALHKCDNPSCVNPKHLYDGTHADNTRDAVERGQYRAGARKHAKLAEDQARNIKQRIQSNEPVKSIHADYPFVSASVINNIKYGHSWSYL